MPAALAEWGRATMSCRTVVLAVAVALLLPPAAARSDRTAYLGDSLTDKVYAFNLRANGSLTEIAGSPFGAGGGPAHIVAAPGGKRIYVRNAAARVSAYDIGPGGGLTEIAGSPFPTGFGIDIAVTPDGAHAYAPNNPVPFFPFGGVTAFRIQPDGSLSEIAGSPFSRPRTFWDLAVTPDGSRAYVTGVWNGGSVYGFDVGADGSLSEVAGSPFSIGDEPYEIAISPSGRYLYYTNAPVPSWYGRVSARRIEADGSLTAVPGSPFPAGTGPLNGIAVTSDGLHVYVTESELRPAAPGAVFAFDVDPATGALIHRRSVRAGNWPNGIAITPDGGRAYVVNSGSNNVSAYDIGADGSLSELAGSPFSAPLAGAQDMVIVGTSAWPILPPSPHGDDTGAGGETHAGNFCTETLRTPLPSVTHWRSFGKTAFRLKTVAGGYLLRSSPKGRFSLQVQRSRRGKKTKVKRVEFALDGRRMATDRRAPYSTTVAPSSLSPGQHTMRATIRSKKGKKRSKPLRFLVSDCEPAAFSAGMRSKRPRTYADLELRVRTGGPELASVRFALSRKLRLATKRARNKKVGTLELVRSDGSKSAYALRARKAKGRSLALSTGAKPRLRLGARGRRTLTVEGLEELRITTVRVKLRGRRTRLLRNPASCKTHRFAATLTSTAGQSVTLKRKLQMCKRGARA